MTDEELIEIARQAVNYRWVSKAVETGSVASALLTDQGKVFTGINIDAKCSLGFCAEHNAIGSMLTAGQNKIATITAINTRGRILPPCGRCLELMSQLDEERQTSIILQDSVVILDTLLPEHWIKNKY